MRNETAIWLLLTTLLVACGEPTMMMATPDGGSPGTDAAVTTDAGFDPSRMYEGEGTTCEFSLECASLQLCIDGECQRHERFEPEELEFGELRWVPQDVLHATALFGDTPGERWLGESWVNGRMIAGAHGPELLFWTPHKRDCEVGLIGADVKYWSLPGIVCSVAELTPEGLLAVGGFEMDEPIIAVEEAGSGGLRRRQHGDARRHIVIGGRHGDARRQIVIGARPSAARGRSSSYRHWRKTT